MNVLYFVRDEIKTGISKEDKPFKITTIEIESYFEENQYSQKKRKHESSFRKLDESKIHIVEHDNKVLNYEIDISFMNNSSSCSGFDDINDLILFKRKWDLVNVNKTDFLIVREKLIKLARPFFKILFDTETAKEFHYKNDYGRHFYNVSLFAFIKNNENPYHAITKKRFDFFLSKEANECGSIRIDSAYGGFCDSFRQARKYCECNRRSKMVSKKDFHRILKRLIKIFDTKQYLDYNSIENKVQDYQITVLNF